MRVAIMQPYFFPYIGYYQLLAAVDLFVVYDNIKYTKKGWINRNRMLRNGRAVVFSLPLKRDSDYVDVCGRQLAEDFSREHLLNQIKGAYGRAPGFERTFPLVEEIVQYREANLFRFLRHSIARTCEHLGITTEVRVSSTVAIDHELRNQAKVLALCEAVGGSTYVNPVGGMELYSRDAFRERGIELRFLRSRPFEYPQFGEQFVPWLSIIDVMMFNPLDAARTCVSSNFDLV